MLLWRTGLDQLWRGKNKLLKNWVGVNPQASLRSFALGTGSSLPSLPSASILCERKLGLVKRFPPPSRAEGQLIGSRWRALLVLHGSGKASGGPGSPVLTSDLHGWDVQAADSQSAKLLPSCSEMVTVAAHTLTRQFSCHGEKPPAFQLGLQSALGRERCQLESWKVTGWQRSLSSYLLLHVPAL